MSFSNFGSKGGLRGARAALLLGLLASVSLASQAAAAAGPPARGAPKYANSNMDYIGLRINVADIDKSVEFYTKIVGLKVAARSGNAQRGQVQLTPTGSVVDAKLALAYDTTKTTPIANGDALGDLVFAVNDIEKRVELLTAAGYKVVRRGGSTPPFNSVPPYPASIKSNIAVWTTDPNGLSVEFLQWNVEGE